MTFNTPEAYDYYENSRKQMVQTQLRARGIEDATVLQSMETIPRHLFVPETLQRCAYTERPLPIGLGQTISQPYIVAVMVESLDLRPSDIVLEIGTGSCYCAAVLSKSVSKVFSIEINPMLAAQASDVLKTLNYDNIEIRVDDGNKGWPEEAPFDAIIVTASGTTVPHSLCEQLKLDRKMVIPVGTSKHQDLFLIQRDTNVSFKKQSLGSVLFVPLISETDWTDTDDETS